MDDPEKKEQNPKRLLPVDTKEITHSGTGRFTWLTMRPMSLYESGESTGEVSLKALFKGAEEIDGESQLEIDRLPFWVCRGGWPQTLGIGPQDLIGDLKTFGFLFETLCVRDLRIFADTLNGSVYHYRDKEGLECDAVIHLRDGSYWMLEGLRQHS